VHIYLGTADLRGRADGNDCAAKTNLGDGC
jgi:hypothetical protein